MANKLLGQHFLKCQWVVGALMHAAEIKMSDTILEIGPGTGVLTRALAKKSGKVIAVEKDKKLATELKEKLEKEKITNVEIIDGDILKFVPSLAWHKQAKLGTNYKVVSNIPYYLTSRIFRLLLENPNRPELIVLTIQKEVARRMVPKPGQMNLLAASIQIFGDPEIVKKVPKGCFSPAPKVDSAIIKISDISAKKLKEVGVSAETFFKIAKIAFTSPRKTILNNLAWLLGREGASLVLAKAGIDPISRPQNLSIQDLLRLAKLA